MLDINSTGVAGPHTIDFSGMTNTAAGQTITLATNLPVLTKPTIVDGFTAPGYLSATPILYIKGVNNIFVFNNTGANGSIIRGIVMHKSTSYGIELNGVSNITVQGCWIGLTTAGAIPGAPASNKINNHGIFINNCSNITVGGTTSALRNVIGGVTASGISIETNSNNVSIIGNYIGINPIATLARANTSHGINAVSSSSITIGGTAAGSMNVIAGNTGSGINMDAIATASIAGNYIGITNATTGLGNGVNGMNILNGSSNVVIGGTTVAHRNIISGNANTGVNIDILSHGTIIKANYIGTDAAGTTKIANLGHGIYINNSNNCVIGNSNAIERNIVSGNGNAGGENGISIIGATGLIIKGNFIGVSSTGLTAIGNFDSGLSLTNVTGATIGGATFMERNIFSGNLIYGVFTSNCDNSTFRGNFAGIDSTGNAALGNSSDGFLITTNSDNNNWIDNVAGKNGNMGFELLGSSANTFYGNKIGLGYNGNTNMGNLSQGIRIGTNCTNNIVGGAAAGQRNFVSGNRNNAIIVDQNATGNIIKGNYVGTDITGLVKVSNSGIGIFVFENSSNNQVGGAAAGEGNLTCCSENSGGIHIQVASNNTVYGNIVGLDANLNPTAGFGNASNGIVIGTHADAFSTSAENNIIGGILAGQKNVISNNTGAGISFNYWGSGLSRYNSAIGNSIYCNTGAGITFSGTPLQEGVVAPVVSSRTLTGISGTGVNGNTVHIYSNVTGDGNVKCDCEAEVYLGQTTVAGVNWSFTYATAFTTTAQSDAVTATQTTPLNSTSTLSPCTAPLPVDWLSFEVQSVSGISILNWQTINEKNNDHFEIQKSKDGISYLSIGTVQSLSTIGNKSYEFNDENPYTGITYYRLKQVDKNGDFSYSEIKILRNENSSFELSIYPNPTADLLNYFTGIDGAYTLSVLNGSGLEVIHQEKTSTLIETQTLDLSQLASGIYHISIRGSSKTLTTKVSKL